MAGPHSDCLVVKALSLVRGLVRLIVLRPSCTGRIWLHPMCLCLLYKPAIKYTIDGSSIGLSIEALRCLSPSWWSMIRELKLIGGQRTICLCKRRVRLGNIQDSHEIVSRAHNLLGAMWQRDTHGVWEKGLYCLSESNKSTFWNRGKVCCLCMKPVVSATYIRSERERIGYPLHQSARLPTPTMYLPKSLIFAYRGLGGFQSRDI
jgi:hypothetical protein